jgi:hypothetical protein
MSIRLTGKLEYQDIGLGTWALVTENGQTYELMNLPSELHQTYAKVEVTGTIRDDIMTIAMIGPVLEVTSFEVLE